MHRVRALLGSAVAGWLLCVPAWAHEDGAHQSVGAWLQCEAQAAALAPLAERWSAVNGKASDVAVANVKTVQEAFGLAAAFLAADGNPQPQDPRLVALRPLVVDARALAAENLERLEAREGLDAAFAQLSQAVRACEAQLQSFEAHLEAQGGS